MSETAQAKESVKATRHRLRLRRFSMVQLLIAIALLFFFVPFVEAIKGGALIVSGLLSLVLLSGVLAVASRRRTLTVALLLAIPAVAGRWLNIFSRTCASASDISCRRNRLSCFCHREFAALCSARLFGRQRSTLREHFGLPDARFDLDDGVLAGGAVDTRSFRVQHDHRDERDDGRFQCLLQLHHAEHGRLRRYHSGFESRPHACRNGSDNRTAQCGGADRSLGRLFIQLQSLRDSYASCCDQDRPSGEILCCERSNRPRDGVGLKSHRRSAQRG